MMIEQSDIKLSAGYELTAATDGDAPLITGIDALLQDLSCEAVTEPGELFYDLDYGWGLKEFVQNDDPESSEIEIRERIKEKLAKREYIDMSSLWIKVSFNSNIDISIKFRLFDSKKENELNIELNRLKVEVIPYD